MPNRRVWIIGAVVAVVLTGAGVAWLVLGRAKGEPPPAAVIVRSIDDPGEQERAAAAAALVTGLPGAFATGDNSRLTEQARAEFGDVRTALPAGARLTVEPSTWRRTGSVASVVATLVVPGQPTETYLVVLAFEGGSWKVSSTVLVPTS